MTEGDDRVFRIVGLSTGNALRLRSGAAPGKAEVGVVARIEQIFHEQVAALIDAMVHLDGHVVSGQAAAHTAEKIVAVNAAAAGSLLQGIDEIRSRDALRV